MSDVRHPLQQLYDNEINFSLNTFWDGGFVWALGDEVNGFLDRGRADTFEQAVSELIAAAIRHHPGIAPKPRSRVLETV